MKGRLTSTFFTIVTIAFLFLYQEQLSEFWSKYGISIVSHKEKHQYLLDKAKHDSWKINQDFYKKIPWDVDIIVRDVVLTEGDGKQLSIQSSRLKYFILNLNNLVMSDENSHVYKVDLYIDWHVSSKNRLSNRVYSDYKDIAIQPDILIGPLVCLDSAVYVYIDKIIPRGIVASIAHQKLSVKEEKTFVITGENNVNCLPLPVQEINDTPVLETTNI